jgi:hypothetical protein
MSEDDYNQWLANEKAMSLVPLSIEERKYLKQVFNYSFSFKHEPRWKYFGRVKRERTLLAFAREQERKQQW